ncbi:MAG: hypothetical protein BJ554DRAFT_1111, partial [Olpidium bornovanus]
MSDTEALKKAKELYNKAKVRSHGRGSFSVERPRCRVSSFADGAHRCCCSVLCWQEGTNISSSHHLKKVAGKVSEVAESAGQKISETISEAAESDIAKASAEKIKKAGKSIHSATEPIRQTAVYNAVASEVAEFVEDTGGRYGGYHDKVTRRTKRGITVDPTPEQAKNALGKNESADKAAEPKGTEEVPANGRSAAGEGDILEDQLTKARVVSENPESGSNVVLHKDSKWRESWKNFKESSRLIQSIFDVKRRMDESDHPLLNAARNVYGRMADTFSGVFGENETAQAIALLRDTVDPKFNLERFMKEAR